MAKNTTAKKTAATARYPEFFNRELSWIEFNRRVLGEALRKEKPLLERLRFLAIVSSNFDEFFMVRVASVKRQFLDGNYASCPTGLSPSRQLQEIRKRVKSVVESQYRVLLKDILPRLEENGIIFHQAGSFSENQQAFLSRIFQEEVFPVLTPVRYIKGETFSDFGSMRLHVAFLLEKIEGPETLAANSQPSPAGTVPRDGSAAQAPTEKPAAQSEDESGEQIAFVQIPDSLQRIVYVPELTDKIGFTFLETLIIQNASQLFSGYTVKEHLVFRATRDADIGVDESRDEDFLQAMEQVLSHRQHSSVVRLSVSRTSRKIQETLREALSLEESEVFDVDQPLDLTAFFQIANLEGFDHLRFEPWKPVEPRSFPEDESVFDSIRRGDIVLNHPYESFTPVVRLVREAAMDPAVLAIKMTLYRTSGDSPIVEALELAASNGKHVTVLVEVKARFDEARNITWADKLSHAGAIVIYGIAKLKVHAKALLVIRKEDAGIRRYLHLGTGNYNDRTARLYSDISFFTTRDDMCYEAGLFFNTITGYSVIPVLNRLVMAPSALKSKLLKLIDREASKSSKEVPGRMILKMNALADTDMIRALYRASGAHVEISLCVRGICMLVPGVPGMSENIRVMSLIDRYLEHTRAFYFRNGGQEEVYCASADWMPRNLEGRVELMFPIEQEDAKARVQNMLELYLLDNTQSYELQVDGNYLALRNEKAGEQVQVQARLYAIAKKLGKRESAGDKKAFTVRRKPLPS